MTKIVSFDSFTFNQPNTQHATTMLISCCVSYNVFIRCSYKYFHKNELHGYVKRHFEIQIRNFQKFGEIWKRKIQFLDEGHVKRRFVEVLSILADVSQQDTWVFKHSILNYFSYRSVITGLELISLNLTLTSYEHASQSYYRRLLLSIWLEHNMVFQYDKMTRGWPT